MKKIVSYRIGRVFQNGIADNAHCCHISMDEVEVFRYIELIYDDGKRSFVYEDELMFKRYEENFDSKRFTSFNEFFTTEELMTDDKSGFPLKYYLRRPSEDYSVKSIDETLNELSKENDCKKLNDRIVYWGSYDKSVDYHM